MSDMAALIVRMATENRSWGYTRIQGALANLGHKVARGRVANILKAHGIDPAPSRGEQTSWDTFLKAHWEILAATDFFTVEVWTLRGLVTHYVLFFIELATRSVHVAGVTTHPNDAFMLQVACNFTDGIGGFLLGKCYLILDRDTKYSQGFREFLEREGIKVIRLPPRSLNLNAYAERFVRSIKDELIYRMIFFGEASLRRAFKEYMAHYHIERNHPGLGNRLLRPSSGVSRSDGVVNRRKRLGGMLSCLPPGGGLTHQSTIWTIRPRALLAPSTPTAVWTLLRDNSAAALTCCQ